MRILAAIHPPEAIRKVLGWPRPAFQIAVDCPHSIDFALQANQPMSNINLPIEQY